MARPNGNRRQAASWSRLRMQNHAAADGHTKRVQLQDSFLLLIFRRSNSGALQYTSTMTTEDKNSESVASSITSRHTRLLLEKSQLLLTIGMICGALVYVGRRSESDDNQSRLLTTIATDIAVMRDRNADASASIKVIAERVRLVEERLGRIESQR